MIIDDRLSFYIKPFWCTKWFEVVALVFTLGECEIPKIQAQAQLLPHFFVNDPLLAPYPMHQTHGWSSLEPTLATITCC